MKTQTCSRILALAQVKTIENSREYTVLMYSGKQHLWSLLQEFWSDFKRGKVSVKTGCIRSEKSAQTHVHITTKFSPRMLAKLTDIRVKCVEGIGI